MSGLRINTFKIVVNKDNYEEVQQALFQFGYCWLTLGGREVLRWGYQGGNCIKVDPYNLLMQEATTVDEVSNRRPITIHEAYELMVKGRRPVSEIISIMKKENFYVPVYETQCRFLRENIILELGMDWEPSMELPMTNVTVIPAKGSNYVTGVYRPNHSVLKFTRENKWVSKLIPCFWVDKLIPCFVKIGKENSITFSEFYKVYETYKNWSENLEGKLIRSFPEFCERFSESNEETKESLEPQVESQESVKDIVFRGGVAAPFEISNNPYPPAPVKLTPKPQPYHTYENGEVRLTNPPKEE